MLIIVVQTSCKIVAQTSANFRILRVHARECGRPVLLALAQTLERTAIPFFKKCSPIGADFLEIADSEKKDW